MESRGRGVIRFGTYEADPVAGELHKNGRRINLQEQPFRLLMLLLEHAGEVVSRTELREKIWQRLTSTSKKDSTPLFGNYAMLSAIPRRILASSRPCPEEATGLSRRRK